MTFETDDNVDTGATENTAAEVETEQTDGGEQQPEQEVEQTEAQKQEEAQKEQKRNRAKERIEQLARENAELKRFKAEQEAKATQSEKPSTRPKIDDFEDFGKYEEALEQYHIDQAEARVLAKLDERESQKSVQEKQIEMQAAIIELEEQGIDFNAYAQKAEELPQLPVHLDQFGLSATDTLKLAKDLLDDEETYIAISQMNPVQAAMKIGQIIGNKTQSKAPPVSKAPKPINPVKANAPATRSPESMSDDEWYRAEQQKRNKGK